MIDTIQVRVPRRVKAIGERMTITSSANQFMSSSKHAVTPYHKYSTTSCYVLARATRSSIWLATSTCSTRTSRVL